MLKANKIQQKKQKEIKKHQSESKEANNKSVLSGALIDGLTELIGRGKEIFESSNNTNKKYDVLLDKYNNNNNAYYDKYISSAGPIHFNTPMNNRKNYNCNDNKYLGSAGPRFNPNNRFNVRQYKQRSQFSHNRYNHNHNIREYTPIINRHKKRRLGQQITNIRDLKRFEYHGGSDEDDDIMQFNNNNGNGNVHEFNEIDDQWE